MRIPFITSAIALVLISSCGSNPEGHALHATDAPAVPILVDSVVSAYNFTFGRPMLPDSGGIVLIPLSMIEKQGEESRKDFLSSKGREQNLPPYWNVLFLDPNTLGTHLLSDGKMWIREIHVPQLAAEEALSGYVLYKLTDTDGNRTVKWTVMTPPIFASPRTTEASSTPSARSRKTSSVGTFYLRPERS